MEQLINSPVAIVAILACFAVILREIFGFVHAITKRRNGKASSHLIERLTDALDEFTVNIRLLNEKVQNHVDQTRDNYLSLTRQIDGIKK